ncbi:MAG: hypothetical protein LBH46_01815, partial [Rickettsiales bacterium]|nr:hypothetical protein [Rickettsiales bacterium]
MVNDINEVLPTSYAKLDGKQIDLVSLVNEIEEKLLIDYPSITTIDDKADLNEPTFINKIFVKDTDDVNHLILNEDEIKSKFQEKFINTGELDVAYVADTDGEQTYYGIDQASSTPDTIARRGSYGEVKTATPLQDEDATNKEYVDGEVAKKADNDFATSTSNYVIGDVVSSFVTNKVLNVLKTA